MPMFPLGTVLFPHALLPLHVFEPRVPADDATGTARRRGVRCRAHRAGERGRGRRHPVRRRHRRPGRARPRSSPTAATRSRPSGMRRIRVTPLVDRRSRSRRPRSSISPKCRRGRRPFAARPRRRCVRSGLRAPPPDRSSAAGFPGDRRHARAGVVRDRGAGADRTARRAARARGRGHRRPPRAAGRAARRSRSHAARAAAGSTDAALSHVRPVDTLRVMTQNFDDDARRGRLQSDQERVQGLIKNLREEGLDQEEADQVGDLSHLPQHQADQGSEVVRAREGHGDTRTPRARARGDRGRVATPRRRHLRDRRGHRRADRCPSGSRRIRSRVPTSTPTADTTSHVDRYFGDRHLIHLTVTLRLFASARVRRPVGAPTSTTSTRRPRWVRCSTRPATPTGPTFEAVLATARVWVNGDEPAERARDPSSPTATRSPCFRRSAAGEPCGSLTPLRLGSNHGTRPAPARSGLCRRTRCARARRVARDARRGRGGRARALVLPASRPGPHGDPRGRTRPPGERRLGRGDGCRPARGS